MKKVIIPFLLLSGVYIFSACNGNDTSTSSTSSDSLSTTSTMDTSTSRMDTANNQMGNTTMVDADTKSFVNDAATGGMMEVELGNLAEQKAKSQRVKDFGKMIVADHTQANNTLKDIAAKKNIDVPASVTNDQREDIDKLSKKSGSDFDKAYVDMMVEDHKKDISDFKSAESKVGDNDVKNFITNTLPVLQKHLDSVQAIKSKM